MKYPSLHTGGGGFREVWIVPANHYIWLWLHILKKFCIFIHTVFVIEQSACELFMQILNYEFNFKSWILHFYRDLLVYLDEAHKYKLHVVFHKSKITPVSGIWIVSVTPHFVNCVFKYSIFVHNIYQNLQAYLDLSYNM